MGASVRAPGCGCPSAPWQYTPCSGQPRSPGQASKRIGALGPHADAQAWLVSLASAGRSGIRQVQYLFGLLLLTLSATSNSLREIRVTSALTLVLDLTRFTVRVLAPALLIVRQLPIA
jgi:hypothetical protein